MNEAAVGRPCYNPLMARGRGVSKMTWGADDGVDVRVGFHVWVGWGGGGCTDVCALVCIPAKVHACVCTRILRRIHTFICTRTCTNIKLYIKMYICIVITLYYI